MRSRSSRNPKTAQSRDVPRQCSSQECVERILAGENHAVCDLVDALERDHDPKFEIINKLLSNGMGEIRKLQPGPNMVSAVVSIWQNLAVNCVRVMLDPTIVARAEDLKKALKIQGKLL